LRRGLGVYPYWLLRRGFERWKAWRVCLPLLARSFRPVGLIWCFCVASRTFRDIWMPQVYPDVQVRGKLGVGGRCWSPAFGLITPAATSDTRWVSFAAHQPAHSPTRLGTEVGSSTLLSLIRRACGRHPIPMRDGTGGLSPGRLVWWRPGHPNPALYRDSSPPSRLTTNKKTDC
jgi:hypothetical protein